MQKTVRSCLLIVCSACSSPAAKPTTAAAPSGREAANATAAERPAAPPPAQCSLAEPVVAPPADARARWVATLEREGGLCMATLGEPILRIARGWHQSAVDGSDAALAELVSRVYRAYLGGTPDSQEAGRVVYDSAALLAKRAGWDKEPASSARLWEEAALAFGRAAEAKNLDEKRRKGAASDAVQCWKNALRNAPPVPPAPHGDAKKPLPLPDSTKRMLAAFRGFEAQLSPADDELWRILYLEAREYWQYRHFDQATPILRRIIKERPRHEVAPHAANLLLDSLNVLERHEELARVVSSMMDNAALMSKNKELAVTLRRLRYQIDRKAANELAEKGDYRGCMHAFVAVYKRDMGMEGMDEVLYNGAICAERAKDAKRAISLLRTLLKSHPGSRLEKQAREALDRLPKR